MSIDSSISNLIKQLDDLKQDPRLSDDPLTALAAVMRHHKIELFLQSRSGAKYYDMEELNDFIDSWQIDRVNCVVVEAHWPIYDETWENVQRQAEGMPTQKQEIETLRSENAELKATGAKMANILFNLKQNAILSDQTRSKCAEAQKSWDSAINGAAKNKESTND